MKKNNSHIFGRLLEREKKQLDKLSKISLEVISHSATEVRLTKNAGDNLYEMGLLNMIMACFRKSKKEKKSMLTKSMDCLLQAEILEDSLMKGILVT